MTQPELIRRQQGILTGLARAVAARNEAAAAADTQLKAALAEVEARYEEGQQQVAARSAEAARRAAQEFEAQRAQMQAEFDGTHGPSEQEYKNKQARIAERYRRDKAKGKKTFQEARWETTTVFEATRHKPKREFLETDAQVTLRAQRLEQIGADARQYLADCRLLREPEIDAEGTPPEPDEDPLRVFVDKLAQAENRLLGLKSARLPRFCRNGGFLWLFLGAWLLLAAPCGYFTDWHASWLVISASGAVVLGSVASVWIYLRARAEVKRLFDPLCQDLVDAELARERWKAQALAKMQREQTENKQKYDTDLARANDEYSRIKSEAGMVRDRYTREIEQQYPPKLAEMRAQFDQAVAARETERRQRIGQLKAEQAAQLAEVEAAHVRAADEARQEHERNWQQLADQWRQHLNEMFGAAAELNGQLRRQFPDWHAADLNGWLPAPSVSPVIPVGHFNVDLKQIPGAMAGDPRLAFQGPHTIELPALLSFPDRASLVLKVVGAGRKAGVETLQAVMLRFMAAVPPGKMRFTIIDPVGLGQNFAGFMHLADYDELLVSHKIWTEPQHIEQRLADLTQHMSTVIQKYLRNEFETIEDYNEHAGEVAEPFRVLVVANFPFNFTEAAMRYLLSIASSGARCGVYVLASIDTKLALPGGFRLADLEQHAIKLVWKETQFVWKEEAVEKFPLVMDSPPPSDRFSRIVHLTGEAAKDSNRVEVPFEFIAPADDAWWTSDSGTGIDVPLGRAGATKRQSMKLGRGTAQHVLIAGKTGSGKSTLLHALITNSALMYSPDQVEMYLIDFKKGVEFKTYAQHQLPHARVIAIESEREFGLSVLQRLDAELKIRGDMFRDLNVQDLNSFRQADPHTRMPRVLLIVDEFQEFFVEDDKIAQDVSLLLDRLVRQGRAFGIHVHLGSQTLGGAYGLARTTLGQMAVRVALQCSEADANLILSEENPAARLLTRPGEAIYNDANGRPEGNNLFQVVWLTDDKHDEYLRRIHELALERRLPTPPQIIFEGNVPAEIGKNTQLEQLISAPAWPASALTTPAWLGEAIAIKDPTAAVIRRQSGANMLMLGQQAEAARALMVSTMFSLAAQLPPAGGDTPGGARFYVLDGSPPDAPQAAALGRIASMLPHPVEVVAARQVGAMMAELAAESERRQTSGETEAPAIFVLIYDLPRFRELRKAEDDFSFSREEKANPAKQLVALLREGPPLGIHVLTWCDTLNNFYRVFERQTLREFETRVLFQMSVADSSSLIDSPAASKLGVFRAFLHSEEQGLLEKFRPYCLPNDEWLARAAELLRRRSVVPATTNPG
jgi:hypothetical protein